VATGTYPGYAEFDECLIRRIKYLRTTAASIEGKAANFNYCAFLEVAKGDYPGYVSFHECGIQSIGKLHIVAPDNEGWAARFSGCPQLKLATGTYPGFVDFSNSGIEAIKDLHIAQPATGGEHKGHKADLRGCLKLKPAKVVADLRAHEVSADRPIIHRLMRKERLYQPPEQP